MAVDYCIIGSRLKQARIKAGLTQQELAEQTNLSVAFISRIVVISLVVDLSIHLEHIVLRDIVI